MNTKAISRRQILKGSGALVVSFSLFGHSSRLLGQALAHSNPYDNPDYLDPRELDSWLGVMEDGTVNVFTGKVDLGTGTETALAQIVAEELDVRFDHIHMAMGDTAKTVDQGRTAGSNTIQGAGPQLRQAAAAARQELFKLASARLQQPVENLTVADGVISVAGDPAQKVPYATLVGGQRFNLKIAVTGTQGGMRIAPEVKPKSYKDYKIVGTSVRRVELARKLTADFTYTPDFRLPGMLHGRVVRPTTVISMPSMVDESSVSHIPGVVKVVREGTFVGVVAETEWAAIQAAKALKVTWSEPETKMPANSEEVDNYILTTKSFTDTGEAPGRGGPTGDVDAAFRQAAKSFEATYHWPFQNHGMMLPSCAIADVRGDKVTIWTGAQGPFTTRDRVSDMLGIPKRNIDVIYIESAGCYGRLTSDDASEDAVLMSRAVGKPVRVQWMRADEHIWEPKGPQQLMMIRAAISDQGKITGWEFTGRTFAWTEAQGTPQLAERQLGQKNTAPYPASPVGAGAVRQLYDIPNQKAVASYIPWPQENPTPLRTNPLRSPGEPAGWYASESFVDEIASALGKDPVEFRLDHLSANRRAADVLRATAEKAGWKPRPSPAAASNEPKASGRGVALINRGNTLVAAVAEVEVNRTNGNVSVKRVTVGFDCGLIINPDGLHFQVEGNIIQGISRALYEEVKFDSSGVKTVDWNSYPVITFRNLPEVEIVLLNHPEMPAYGAGEPGVVPIPGAIANAIFDAVGVRLRQAPFTPQRVLAGLKGKTTTSQRL